MLPSKGYFKSLNCPYFQNGFCDRPHCHFRHTKRDKAIDDITNENQTTIMDTNIPKERKETWAVPQAASVSYKPTPIAELKKRHLPVNTAPTANSSIKRRMEYNVRKPKIEYMPEVPSYDSYSGVESYPAPVSNTVQQVYKATRISERKSNKSEAFITDMLQGSPADDVNDESGDDDIDLEQVSTELNFLDQFLKEYETEDGTNTNINHQLNSNSAQVNEETNSGQCNQETVNAFAKLNNNTTNKENKSTPHTTGKINSDDQNIIDDSRNRENRIAIPKRDTFNSDNEPIKTKKTDHCNESSSKVSAHSKSDKKSDQKKDQHHHSRQESDKHKHKKSEETSICKSESKKQEKENNVNSCKTNINESEKSKEKLQKKDKSSSTRHKSTSSKPSKSDSENKSSSHKSSKKDKEHQSSSKSKIKDHGDNVSKSLSKHKLDEKKINESSSRNSKKDESKTKTKPSESKKRDEDKHKKEKHDKNKEKYRHEKRKRESEENEKPDSQQLSKKCRLSKPYDDYNEVEIISDSESIIIIDSDDSNKDKRRNRKTSNRSDRVSLSPELNQSPGLPSDSDSDSAESVLENVMSNEVEQQSKNAPTQSEQDDTLLVDHRVMSRMKNRVSLGSTWRPPTKKRVEPVTPAQRMQLFRKQLQEQDEKDEQAPIAPRVRIGCGINVKGLLEEKKRLLLMNDSQKRTAVSGNSTARPVSGITSQSSARTSTDTPEDKDEPPKVERKPHPEKAGAELTTRQRYMDLLYRAARQLVKPGRLYASAREKCIKAEENIYLKTNHNTYCAQMKGMIETTTRYIPEFTLNYFLKLKPREDALFPPELKRIDENGHVIKHSFYEALHKYLLTEEELENEGYPRWKKDPECSGLAYINAESINRWKVTNPNIPPRGELACSKCNNFYRVDEQGLSLDPKGCSYHAKKAGRFMRSKGERIKLYVCCNQPQEKPCLFSKYHSTETADFQNLEGFRETQEDKSSPEPHGGWGVYALDCEMVWTTFGLELGRVTVLNAENRIVLDTCVRQDRLVTDYISSLSGLSEEDLTKAPLSFTEVQEKLLMLFNSKSILIGHSLENDLKVLKIIHNKVVDTSMVFKSRDKKLGLKVLAKDILGIVIQSEDVGHSSAEDAETCLLLLQDQLKKDFCGPSKKANAPIMRFRNTSRSSCLMSP